MKNSLFFLILLCVATLEINARAQTDYTIGPQDVLTINRLREAELSGKYTVEQDGTFTFPQVGRVKAGGLTLRGVEQELKKLLSDGQILRNATGGRRESRTTAANGFWCWVKCDRPRISALRRNDVARRPRTRGLDNPTAAAKR